MMIISSNIQTIESGLADIVREPGIGKTANDALQWLSGQCKEWLLLLDNADDPSINL
jgi:hypothetical protein